MHLLQLLYAHILLLCETNLAESEGPGSKTQRQGDRSHIDVLHVVGREHPIALGCHERPCGNCAVFA